MKAGGGPPALQKAIGVCHGESRVADSSGVLEQPGRSEEEQTQYVSQGTL